MIGSKHNKNPGSRIYDLRSKSGQALLIIIMLLATALTVALSVSFKSTTETQVTKLEEESQKALAAAEAGIEAALKQKTNINIGSLSVGNFTGDALISPTTSKEFVTPLINKDEQYTFYLVSYDPVAKTLGSDYWTGNLNLYFKTESADCPALELTFIKTSGDVTRNLLDHSACNKVDAASGETPVTTADASAPTTATFEYMTSSPFNIVGANQYQLLVVRTVGGATKIGFKEATGTGNDFKLQGTTVVSEAKSTGTGVTKKVTLFQSYPQIPAEFFVTSF